MVASEAFATVLTSSKEIGSVQAACFSLPSGPLRTV